MYGFVVRALVSIPTSTASAITETKFSEVWLPVDHGLVPFSDNLRPSDPQTLGITTAASAACDEPCDPRTQNPVNPLKLVEADGAPLALF